MNSKNKPANLLIMFNKIIEDKLTPNQFYMLYCMKEGISPPLINMHQEIRTLVNDEWLKDETNAEDYKYSLNPKAMSIIANVESYFNIMYKKSNMSILGPDFEHNAQKYNELFPKMKLPSNKPARSPIKEIISAFREFFKDYDYSWDIIHEAAAYYIEEERNKGFKYTRTSRYFIRKQDSDKTWISDLAAYCELVKNGEDFDKPQHSEKVF